MSLIYGLFAFLDWIVYNIAAVLFNVIFRLSYFRLFQDNSIVNGIVNRVYLVFGILIFFKFIMSAVQYIINPDSFDDKEKGFMGLIKNSVITVILIALVPAIFEFAISIQADIVEAIPGIVFGQNGIPSSDKSSGESVAFSVLTAFVHPVKGKDGSISGYDSKGKYVDGKIKDFDTFITEVKRGVGFLDDSNRVYDYMYLISTAGGCFLAYMLLSMSLDIAIRTFKLAIIQMLAPIPISSYMFKKDNFNKFVKTSLQVYFDLFIRMAVVYIVLLVLQLVPSLISDLFSSNTSSQIVTRTGFLGDLEKGLTTVALIFGLLMFASKAPKFVTDLLGLPEIGSGDLKEMFKPAWQRAGGAAAALSNPLRTAAASAINSWQQGGNLRWGGNVRRALRAAAAGVRGAGQGTVDSLKGIAAGDDYGKMRQKMQDRDTRNFKRAYKAKTYRDMAPSQAWEAQRNAYNAKIAGFFGQTTVNSEGYKNAANALNTLRSEAFTGRAKNEVDKAPTLFSDLNSSGLSFQVPNQAGGTRPINTTFSAKDASGNIYGNVDYGALHALYTKIQAGTATAADYESVTYRTDPSDPSTETHFTAADAAKISDVHERIGKKAYAEYVNIAVAANQAKDDPSLSPAERDKLNGLADTEVLQRIDRTREALMALNIPNGEKDKLIKELEKDPGSFLAGANKKVQEFLTKAAQLEKMEQAQSGGKQ